MPNAMQFTFTSSLIAQKGLSMVAGFEFETFRIPASELSF
jgi:hypothetical protein